MAAPRPSMPAAMSPSAALPAPPASAGTGLRTGPGEVAPTERAEQRRSRSLAIWKKFEDDVFPRGLGPRGRMLGALAATLGVAGICRWFGWTATATAVVGAVGLTIGFRLGMAALALVLSGSNGIVAVARAMVAEVLGTRLPTVLLAVVFVGLPALPLALDPSERLEYRLQFFLEWSLSAASVILALVAIVMACGSVCGDIDTQRIHMTLVKPLRRWEYLLGKWFGIVLLELLLVLIVGGGVAVCVATLATLPALDAVDRRAVDEQVLTARSAVRPDHPQREEFERAIAAEVERSRQEDPSAFAQDAAGARKRIRARSVLRWHTVTPDVVESYLFSGLDRDRIRSPVVQLRLKPFVTNSGISRADVRFAMWLNERAYPSKGGVHEEFTFRTGSVHTIEVPTSVIGDDGRLLVTIANRNLVMPGEDTPTSISFSPGDGLELLYRTGGFAGNFSRGLIVMWAKLAMIAAAALAAAAWLGFPTAVLASLMVLVTAVASGFFADALDIYTGLDDARPTLTSMLRLRGGMLLERLLRGEFWEAAKTVSSILTEWFLVVVPSFADYNSIGAVASGRVVSATDVAWCCGELGLAYPVVLLALGWMLLESRDLVNTSGSAGG